MRVVERLECPPLSLFPTPSIQGRPLVKLNELIALNDEILALVRAGVPLDRGLASFAPELPGRLREQVERLSERLAAGETLSAVLADPTWKAPAHYQAVVAAGCRAGRLEAALEGLAASARRQRDSLRRAVTAAVYPFFVAATAYASTVFLFMSVLPVVVETTHDMTGPPPAALTALATFAGAPWPWFVAPALAAAAGFGWWSWRTDRPLAEPSSPDGERAGKRSSGRGRARWNAARLDRLATFADVLALLLENSTPTAEAVELAGRAAGGRAFPAAGERLAERLRRGESIVHDPPEPLGAWVVWLIAGESPNRAESLRIAAAQFRDEAAARRRRMARFAPLAATLLGGAVVVTFYALAMIYPLSRILHTLARP